MSGGVRFKTELSQEQQIDGRKQLLVWLVWRTKHLTLWKLIMETLAVLGVDKQSGQVYQPRYFKRQVSRISYTTVVIG